MSGTSSITNNHFVPRQPQDHVYKARPNLPTRAKDEMKKIMKETGGKIPTDKIPKLMSDHGLSRGQISNFVFRQTRLNTANHVSVDEYPTKLNMSKTEEAEFKRNFLLKNCKPDEIGTESLEAVEKAYQNTFMVTTPPNNTPQ